jgi:hypothetical protein
MPANREVQERRREAILGPARQGVEKETESGATLPQPLS